MFAISLPGLVLALLLLGTWESLVARVQSRRGRPARRPSAWAGFDVLHGLFDPSKEHALEERRHSLLMRDEQEEGAPPATEVDLVRGTAVVRLPGRHGPDGPRADRTA